MKFYLTVEVTFKDESVKDQLKLGRYIKSMLGEFVAGDWDNLILDNEEIEALEYGVSVVPDPCASDGVIARIQRILGNGAPRSCCQLADGAKAVLKFCKEYTDADGSKETVR